MCDVGDFHQGMPSMPFMTRKEVMTSCMGASTHPEMLWETLRRFILRLYKETSPHIYLAYISILADLMSYLSLSALLTHRFMA